MAKLTNIVCSLLLILCFIAFSHANNFGSYYIARDQTRLSFDWQYWGWGQKFSLYFDIYSTTASRIKPIMDTRVRYTEGCFDPIDCKNVTLFSMIMEMENIKYDLFNANYSGISINFGFGMLMNVDRNSLEFKVSNLGGDVVFSSQKAVDTEFISFLNMASFLDRNEKSLLFTFTGDRLPARFNYSMGQDVKVDFKQQNHFESSNNDIDLIVGPQPFTYTLSNEERTLETYYDTICDWSSIYGWLNVIKFSTNKQNISDDVQLTYSHNSNVDYFGNAIDRLLMEVMIIYQPTTELYLIGSCIRSGSCKFQNFHLLATDETVIILAHEKYRDTPIIDASKTPITKGTVSKGLLASYMVNVNFTDTSNLLNFHYQTTSQDSSVFFTIGISSDGLSLCSKSPQTIKKAQYSTHLMSLLLNTNNLKKGENVFTLLVGCTSSNECEFSFGISQHQPQHTSFEGSNIDSAKSSKQSGTSLVPIIVPIVFVLIFLSVLIAIVGVLVYLKIRKNRQLTTAQSDKAPLVLNY